MPNERRFLYFSTYFYPTFSPHFLPSEQNPELFNIACNRYAPHLELYLGSAFPHTFPGFEEFCVLFEQGGHGSFFKNLTDSTRQQGGYGQDG